MRTIRASEIGAYFYCRRAWWYQIQGYESINQIELSEGNELHNRHGRMVVTSTCLQYAAYGMLLVALLILALYLANHFI